MHLVPSKSEIIKIKTEETGSWMSEILVRLSTERSHCGCQSTGSAVGQTSGGWATGETEAQTENQGE